MYVCKRLRLKAWLDNHGFVCRDRVRDFNNDKYWVFLYENSPELQACVSEYVQMRREQKSTGYDDELNYKTRKLVNHPSQKQGYVIVNKINRLFSGKLF